MGVLVDLAAPIAESLKHSAGGQELPDRPGLQLRTLTDGLALGARDKPEVRRRLIALYIVHVTEDGLTDQETRIDYLQVSRPSRSAAAPVMCWPAPRR